jgi:hypothetical protein
MAKVFGVSTDTLLGAEDTEKDAEAQYDTEREQSQIYVLETGSEELFAPRFLSLMREYGGASITLEVMVNELKKLGITPKQVSEAAGVALEVTEKLFSEKPTTLEVTFGKVILTPPSPPDDAALTFHSLLKSLPQGDYAKLQGVIFRLCNILFDVDSMLRNRFGQVVQKRGISCKTLSKYTGIPSCDIDMFPTNPAALSRNDKYKLCAVMAELEDVYNT